MPVSVDWLDQEQNVALYRLEGYWTISNLVEHLKEHVALQEKQPSYYIVDMSDSNIFPTGILSQHSEYTQYFHLRDGMTVLVNAPTLAVAMFKVLSRVGVKFHNMAFVDTINKAMQTIEKHQQTPFNPLVD